MRTWSLHDDPGRLTILLDGEEFACVHWEGDDASEIAQFSVDALNAAEQRGRMEGPWGDCGPFCPYCGNLRGKHRSTCQTNEPYEAGKEAV